eukprot:jgi/Bigna1/143179/aug1.76_g17887
MTRQCKLCSFSDTWVYAGEDETKKAFCLAINRKWCSNQCNVEMNSMEWNPGWEGGPAAVSAAMEGESNELVSTEKEEQVRHSSAQWISSHSTECVVMNGRRNVSVFDPTSLAGDKTPEAFLLSEWKVEWEGDFIKELMSDVKSYVYCYGLNITQLAYERTRIRTPLVLIASQSGRLSNWLISPEVAMLLKPSLLIHLSEEWGAHYFGGHDFYATMHSYGGRVMRQYQFPELKYTSSFLQYLPLGYNTEMLGGRDSCEVAKESAKIRSEDRKYSWGFIGSEKTDRVHMIETFKKSLSGMPMLSTINRTQHSQGKLSRSDTFKAYRKVIIAPNGRGNAVLDCFRLYETGIAGAIPMIVGSDDEINNLLSGQLNPPWLVAKTWEEAAQKAQELIDEPWRVDRIRELLARCDDALQNQTNLRNKNEIKKKMNAQVLNADRKLSGVPECITAGAAAASGVFFAGIVGATLSVVEKEEEEEEEEAAAC